MDVMLLTPFSTVPKRSVAVADSVTLYSGRWAEIDTDGNAIVATGAKAGYLVLEGTKLALTVDGSHDVLTDVALPSAVAANQVALAYGIYRAVVDAQGFVGTSVDVGDGLELDNKGRLVVLAAGVRVATCEAITSDQLTFRTLGA
jgi:hypothetical protein